MVNKQIALRAAIRELQPKQAIKMPVLLETSMSIDPEAGNARATFVAVATDAGMDAFGSGAHNAGDLLWYRYDRSGSIPADSLRRWHPASSNPIGTGWDMMKTLLGRGGWLFGVDEDGELIAYRYRGKGYRWWLDATAWSGFSTGVKIGSGFDRYRLLTCGHSAITLGPVVYGVTEDGALHRGVANFRPIEMTPIDSGWGGCRMILGGDADELFSIDSSGNLNFHPARVERSGWWPIHQGLESPIQIGTGWGTMRHVFTGIVSGGRDFYAVDDHGSLYLYHTQSIDHPDPGGDRWDPRVLIWGGWMA